MNQSSIKYLPFFILLIFISCGKDSVLENENIDIQETSVKVDATIQGIIINQDEVAIEGAEIKINNAVTSSDINGFYSLKTFVDQKGESIIVSKSGYHKSLGTIIPIADSDIKVNVMLIPKETPHEEDSGNRITVSKDNELSVVFEPQSFEDETGNAYMGALNIYSHYIDPTDSNHYLRHPGSALTSNINKNYIQMICRADIELFSASGDKLDINQAAELKMAIPPDFRDIAPDLIPLWYFDEETGFWVEEGIATKQGNHYIGRVNHFTSWACGLIYERFQLSGKVTLNSNNYTSKRIEVNGISDYHIRSTYTNTEGFYSLEIPEYFENLEIKIKDNCNIEIHSENLSALTEDRNYDVDFNTNINFFEVAGQVYCDDLSNPVSDAYVIINFENANYGEIAKADENGNYQILVDNCNNNKAELQAFDIANELSSDKTAILQNGDVDLNVCETPVMGFIRIETPEYGVYEIPGATFEYESSKYYNTPFMDTILSQDYVIHAVDFFDNSGDFLEYEMFWEMRDVNLTGHEGQFPPPRGFTYHTGTENPPIKYTLGAYDVDDGVTINQRTETFLSVSLKDVLVQRVVNGQNENLTGTVFIEAYK